MAAPLLRIVANAIRADAGFAAETWVLLVYCAAIGRSGRLKSGAIGFIKGGN
jgi:hypothetical protein